MTATNKDIDPQATKATLLQYTDLLKTELFKNIGSTWACEQDVMHLDALEETAYLSIARIIDIGDIAAEAISNGSEDPSNYGICYTWAGHAQSFVVLFRNIIFEEQKALLFVSEGKAEMNSYKTLKSESKDVLMKSAQDLIDKLNKHINTDQSGARLVRRLSLKDNPWEVYKTQIANIGPQCEDLVHQFKSLWNVSGLYVLVKSNLQDDFTNQKAAIEKFKQSVKEISSSLEFEESVEISELVKQLTVFNEELLSDRSFQDMSKDLHADIKALPGQQKIVIQQNGNKLAFEELDLNVRTRSWLDSELLPLLNNFYAIRSNIKNQFNLSLSNIKNRISAQREQGVPFDKTELKNALDTFLKRVEKSEQQILSIKQEVGTQLNDLSIHKVYDGNFLYLSIASTLNQYNKTNKQRFEGVKKWIAEKGIFVKQFQDSVQEEERLSISEKLVRVINARIPRQGSRHYTNMFMTKGYIGTSFMVGRADELNHISSIIENWNNGFRGAVMITGTRFSGKTLLAEVVSQKYFSDKTIKLIAGKKLQVDGRHLDPTMSLEEQLNFVVKYSLQNKALVLLDDLHQWHDKEHSLLSNVRAMSKIIDRYSNKLFFIVCLNNWQKERLNIALNLDSVFQAEINTDKVSLDELNQAVLIRHSATHTELVDENGDIAKNKSIYKKLNSIYRTAHGNIGESLFRWAQDIEMFDDDKVRYVYHDFKVPPFLNGSSSILLKTILVYGSTNEYNLRRLFGPSFTTEYRPILQRMINVGVVRRNVNGKLEVRESIINDIAALLSNNTNFTFLKKYNATAGE